MSSISARSPRRRARRPRSRAVGARPLLPLRTTTRDTAAKRVGLDGHAKHLLLTPALTLPEDGIPVDFAGTSPASASAINAVLNYPTAYTAFGIKCLVAPEVPNNAGSLEPLTVSAPEGCILNVKRPWAVAARHTVGHMLPDLVFGCLHQVMPADVPAEGPSSLWNPPIYGSGSQVDDVEDGTAARGLAEFST